MVQIHTQVPLVQSKLYSQSLRRFTNFQRVPGATDVSSCASSGATTQNQTAESTSIWDIK